MSDLVRTQIVGFLMRRLICNIPGSRDALHEKKHRRSHSAEASYSLPTQIDDTDLLCRDNSGRAVSPELTGTPQNICVVVTNLSEIGNLFPSL